MASVRPLPITNHDSTPPIQREVVRPRPAPSFARPNVVLPRSFTDAQEVADRFKANQPVIMNLQGLDRDLARRLIDFASGLCYGLGGQMNKVAKEVFLLTPVEVQVPDEEMRRLTGRVDGT
jgi:cell division inhibitor SepF